MRIAVLVDEEIMVGGRRGDSYTHFFDNLGAAAERPDNPCDSRDRFRELMGDW